ncbi:MAG: hypothetical protein JST84_24220 [Acidobacteria bacterium]|nr:hypothetical protein [Acidobacteriota bacterium]
MDSLSSFETLSRQYLLGELTEAELAAMQQDIFSDQEKFYQLCEIEDRLLDDYARGALTAEQQRRFEQRYVSNPARRRRVEFAQAMAREFQRETKESPASSVVFRRWQSVWQGVRASVHTPRLAVSAAIIVVILLLISTAWLWMEREGLHQKVAQLEGQPSPSAAALAVPTSPTPTISATPTPTALPSPSVRDMRVVNLTVLALALRSEKPGTETKLVLPREAEQVRLHIQLPAQPYKQYAVRLQDAQAQEVFSQGKVKARSEKGTRIIVVTIPVQRLQPGTLVLTIEGLADNGEREPVSKQEIQVTRK